MEIPARCQAGYCAGSAARLSYTRPAYVSAVLSDGRCAWYRKPTQYGSEAEDGMFWRQALLTYGTFDPTDSYYQNERRLFDYATHHYKVLAARGGGARKFAGNWAGVVGRYSEITYIT